MPTYQVTSTDTFSKYNSRGTMDRDDRPPTYDGHRNGRSRGHKRTTSISQLHLSDEDYVERVKWSNKAEYIFTIIGFSVGLGNLVRFPYLAAQYGGAAFFIPYCLTFILVGMPLLYMESSLGQFSRLSHPKVWRCAPVATGVGLAAIIVTIMKSISLSLTMTYSIIYFGSTFHGVKDSLPWMVCATWWTNLTVGKECLDRDFSLPRCPRGEPSTNCTDLTYSSETFWNSYVLGLGKGLDVFGDVGDWTYYLPLALLASWTCIFLVICKGIRSMGKVAYLTTLLPYCVLIAILTRAATLNGALQGLNTYFAPDWSKLMDPLVWKISVEEILYNLGISWGVYIVLGSYNRFGNKVHFDSVAFSIVHMATTVLYCCVVYTVLGVVSARADVNQKGLENLALTEEGEYFHFSTPTIFIAFAEALSMLPLAWVWCALYFFMVFILTLNATSALVETACTALYDCLPKLRLHKSKLSLCLCISIYLLALPMVSANGPHIHHLLEEYGIRLPIIWVALWQVVSVMWIYGYKNFSEDICLMLGGEPNWFWKICWILIAPAVLLTIFISSFVPGVWKFPAYNEVAYQEWGHWIGYILAGVSAVQVPLWAVIMILAFCCKRKMLGAVHPTNSWGPGDPKIRRSILEEEAGITTGRPHSGYREAYTDQTINAYNQED